MGAIFRKGVPSNDQIISTWPFICAIQQGKRDLSCFFSVFTREYPVLDLLFRIVTCVEGAVPAPRRFLFATVYSLVVRPISHLDPGCMNNGNDLDNVANLLYPRNSMVVTLACGQMQEDSLHRRVGGVLNK